MALLFRQVGSLYMLMIIVVGWPGYIILMTCMSLSLTKSKQRATSRLSRCR